MNLNASIPTDHRMTVTKLSSSHHLETQTNHPDTSSYDPSSLALLFSDVARQCTRRLSFRRPMAPPLLSETPTGPTPVWYRVCCSVLETVSWVEKEKHSADVVHRKLQKELTHYHEEERDRAARERRQQRESRARLGGKLHLLAKRYWARRGEGFQQAMNLEFQTVKQYYDRQKQESLLAETEALTKKLVDSMLHRRSATWSVPADVEESGEQHPERKPPNTMAIQDGNATSMNEEDEEEAFGFGAVSGPIESRLALLDTLNGQRPLRTYQRLALKWMIHLYDSNLNGILADEMGLGKTVQTIALLCYFAQYRNDWGPHLVVVPTTVVLNWKEEFERWAPGLKIITYIGSPKERLQCRKGWLKEDAFHVCITSYNLVVNDRSVFRRRPWGFLVLDEAHQIKNFMSKKWQSLFDLKVDYRLLLTGTPLQNSIMELWSLFHFLLPFASAFQSNEEFKEWFSNPLDDMVSGRSALNESIIRRLQALLRPFMLRRLKREVESQLPTKTEKVVSCRLSRRQRALYDDYMQLTDTKRRIQKGGVFSVLLALRKVCDHPDLFEERPTVSPFVLDRNTAIVFRVPRCALIQDQTFRYRFPCRESSTILAEIVDVNEGQCKVNSFLDWLPCAWLQLRFIWGHAAPSSHYQRYHPSLFSSFLQAEHTQMEKYHHPVSHLFSASSNLSHTLSSLLYTGYAHTALTEWEERRQKMLHFQHLRYLEVQTRTVPLCYPACVIDAVPLGVSLHIMSRPWWSSFQDLCPTVSERLHAAMPWLLHAAVYVPKAIVHTRPSLQWGFPIRRPQCFQWKSDMYAPLIAWSNREREKRSGDRLPRATVYNGSHFLSELWPLHVRRSFSFPDKYLLIHDCGKLQYLETALKKLRVEGHRVLIFTQFVKMLNILERFLALIGVAYLRLDGATRAEQRQFNVQRFNSDERITVMILSTRSGGIGLNLTGADTVIFYDSDWNPTMDLQAQDRCHRIGQTRPVTIYRLISAHTIEESILEKARERKKLNNVVIRGGQFNTIATVGAGDIHGEEEEGSRPAEGNTDEEARSAAAFALLTMKTDLRAFFHDMDEDAEIPDPSAADEGSRLLEEMKGAEDAEDRIALEQFEAEMQERRRDDEVDEQQDDADDPRDPAAFSSNSCCRGRSDAADWEEELDEKTLDEGREKVPPLKLYREEPALQGIANRRKQQFLQRSRTPLDKMLTSHYGVYRPEDAQDRYETLYASYHEKINLEGMELPRFSEKL